MSCHHDCTYEPRRKGHREDRGKCDFLQRNVNGSNEPVKHGKVLAHLRQMQADVIFLLETHLKNEAHSKIRARWINQVYHSRGVAILISKRVPFLHKRTIADKEGRYILVAGDVHCIPVTPVNVFGKN